MLPPLEYEPNAEEIVRNNAERGRKNIAQREMYAVEIGLGGDDWRENEA